MAGTPIKRERIERARANGELTSPMVPVGEVIAEAIQPKKKSQGASAERMRELVEIRRKYAREGRPEAMGGRPRTKRSRAEAEEDALQKMVPKALKVLEEQLDDPDERVRQSAAVKVLEWGKGKPSQSVKIDGDQTHTIRYETVISLPDVIQELPDAETVLDEIEPADWTPQIGPGDEPDAA
jgi:HEAT repeat protein